MQSAYQIFVPTRDSARWIGAFAHAWRGTGRTPLFVVDARTADCTRDILREQNMPMMDVLPTFDRVEDIIWRVSERIGNGWLLRIDDDEMPSRAMLDWIDAHLLRLTTAAVWFSRRWCLRDGEGRLCYARPEWHYWSTHRPDLLDPQCRLFDATRIQPARDIHTPGFTAEGTLFAPAHAYLCHFNWLTRTVANRLQKIQAYDAQSPGAGTVVAEYYLPECFDMPDLRLTALPTGEFGKLNEALACLA